MRSDFHQGLLIWGLIHETQSLSDLSQNTALECEKTVSYLATHEP